MAGSTDSRAAASGRAATEGFGQVSRTRDVLFRYLLLAATLVGIVSLAVLLVYVSLDALQPFSADPTWYPLFGAAFVLPVLGTAGYLYRRDRGALKVGSAAVGVGIGTTMAAAGVSVLFIEVIAPTTWLAYALALAVGVGVVALHRWTRPVAGFWERAVVTALGLGAAWYAVPRIVLALPIRPAAWLTMLLTFGVPAAAATGWLAARRRSRREGIGVGVAVLLTAFVGANAGVLLGIGGLPGTLMTVLAVLPTALYVVNVALDRPRERIGLLLPAVVLAGGAVVVAAERFLDVTGPESWVDWQFLVSPHETAPAEAGLYPALVGSVMLMIIVALLAFPVGVGAAVYLEEYAPSNRTTRLIQVNISNLAGVPSVVYGLLGLGIFINFAGLATGSLLVGGMTLALLILPIVVISAQEAIRSVPDSMRQASYGMGATRWQTIRNVVLPRAMPGILTGTILALGRAIGETAPLIMIGAPAIAPVPDGLLAKVSAMPMQVFAWATVFARPAFYTTALAAGVVVMLVVLLTMNSIAIVLRNKYEREA
jgi:phosphate transport system permease protein